jgi:hypothetical protein
VLIVYNKRSIVLEEYIFRPIIHQCSGVKLETVWIVIKKDIPELKQNMIDIKPYFEYKTPIQL